MLKRFTDRLRVSAFALALMAGVFILPASTLHAQVTLPPVTVGAGMQTSYVHTDPDTGNTSDRFLLNSARLYVSGPVTEKIKFMFNTEYDGGTNHVGILDAVARLEFSPKFNVWAGRLLPPSDRANLYGPYYAHHWATFSDGIQNGHPFVSAGRDNGVVYWGDFSKVKVSGGAFDGFSATGKTDIIGAGRIQVDLWDAESGYYLNGTYYGDKDLLAFGVASQVQTGNTATTADFLLEKKLGGGGVVSVEGEYAFYNELGGYDSNYNRSQGAYGLAAYLFPNKIGMGQIEVLGKYGEAKFSRGKTGIDAPYVWKTTEIDVNYVIKQFNARVSAFYIDQDYDRNLPGAKQYGVGLQVQL